MTDPVSDPGRVRAARRTGPSRAVPGFLGFAAALLVAPGAPVHGEEILRIVVERVVDGDTFHGRALSGSAPAGTRTGRAGRVSVRLSGIDSPERDQPWGDSARAALRRRIDGDTVDVECSGTDRYGRVLGRILAHGADVNALQIAEGHAWMYRRYSSSARLDSLELSLIHI